MYAPVFQKIDDLLRAKQLVVVALDGPCASGKTTLATKLSQQYACTILRMDDFFLKPHQRTPERLAEPGGNIDYERFRAEVVEGILKHTQGTYKSYNCQTDETTTHHISELGNLCIVEGSYSHHPYFNNPYDLRIFIDIDSTTQLERLKVRNPKMFDTFVNKWIPLEEAYFLTHDIRAHSDLVI